MPQKINLVTVVLDGTYLLEEHFETIFEAYLEPILKHMKQQQIIIEKEDKEKKGEIEKNKITPKLKCGLVVFGNYEPISRSPVTTYYFEENLSQFEKLITGIEFEDGGMKENAVAEGLVAALEMFDAHKGQIKQEIPEATETIRHCLLISNSHPCPDLIHRNLDEKYDQFSMKQIADEMKNQKIHLSLITPERNITELEELMTEVNQGVEVHNATDVINSSHVVKLAGFKLPFTPPKEVSTAQKRKREDSTSSTGTNDQQISSAQNSGNEAKKVKLEQAQEIVKEHPPIPNGQLLGQQSQPLQTPSSSTKKDQSTVTQNPPVQQQPISQSSSVNTTPAQTTPKSQISTVQTATTSNTNSIPPQVIQIPPNILTQTQQPVKITNITNQAATNNVTAVQMQPSVSTSSATISRPQRPPQQAITGSLMARPQQNMSGVKFPTLHAQLQARLAAMTPDERKQYFASLQSQQLFRNPQLIGSALANAGGAQRISSNPLIQNALIQQELARRQQLNLSQTMLSGAQVQQQIGNFVTSAAPISETVSTQALNGFATSASLNAVQQLDAFNASTVPQPVGYTSASTSVGTINTQFGGNATATNSTQLPVSTMINSISAGMNNIVTGQTATSINNGQIRPNLPQKKVNALWNGHIAWSANNQGQKRELTCQVTAFPITTKKTAPTSQVDYMISCWPDKMEISGLSYAKDVLSGAITNAKIVSFFPSPTPTQENTNTFGVLMRILDGRKTAAFVRFPNAPNPNGGIVLFTNTNNGPTSPKLFGILFLDTPLPTSASVASQGQQIRPPTQQTQLNMQQLQFLAASLRNQQQQQPAMQMQASAAVLQQNALQQQQKLALHTQLQQQQQQQQMASLPLNMQQMLQQQQQQQQRQVMQPTSMLQNGNDFYLRQLLQTARNANPGLSTQQLLAILRQRNQPQQPTQ